MGASSDLSSANSGGDLRSLLQLAARRGWIVVVALIVGVAVAVAISAARSDQYKSTSALLFRPLQIAAQVTGLPLQVPGDAGRDATTNLKLVSLEAVRTAAAARLNDGSTADSLDSHIAVSADGESSVVTVTATADSARQAMRIADAVAQAYVDQNTQQIKQQLSAAITALRQQIATTSPRATRSLDLQNLALRRLLVLNAVTPGDVRIVQPAQLPDDPSSPSALLVGVLGGFVGLLIGLAAALGAEQLDRRLRRPEEVQAALELPLLASVPRSKVFKRGPSLRTALPPVEAESFKRLRANVRNLAGGDLRTLMVTSSGAESGKTTVALHLAAAAAAAGQRVTLVEADLRRPRLAAMLGSVDGDGGLAEELSSTNGAAVQWDRVSSSGVVATNGETATHGDFRILFAGGTPGNASELLESPRMTEVLRQARLDSDLVIVDSPPPGLVSDAIPLLKSIDGVVVVGRLGRDSQADLEQLAQELERLGAHGVGAVATFTRARGNPYAAAAPRR